MKWFYTVVVAATVVGCGGATTETPMNEPTSMSAMAETAMERATAKIVKTEAEWRAQLTPLQYKVTREDGTEFAFTGEYWDHKKDGVYYCIGCQLALFDSKTKYDSGTGWPSYTAPISDDAIVETEEPGWENSGVFELKCVRCGAHLGHILPDGPAPDGLRYCINSASLTFAPRGETPPAKDNASE